MMQDDKPIIQPAWLERDETGGLRSRDYGDVYFQPADGPDESTHVFLNGNALEDRFHALPPGGRFVIGELGFGTGLNFMLAWELFERAAPKDARLHFVSFEKHPILRADLEDIHAHWPGLSAQSAALRAALPPLLPGLHQRGFANGRVTLLLCTGNVTALLPELRAQVDAWFLDGFAPAKNADMWGEGLFEDIAKRTAPNGTVATFSVAGHVRRGLQVAGFGIEKIPGYGRKREMLTARLESPPEDAPRGEDAFYVLSRVEARTALVVGAGVAGCATAYALSRAGVRVTLIDRADGPGRETSGNPAGAVYPKLSAAPSPQGDFYRHAFAHAAALFVELGETVFTPCGVLHLDTDDNARERHEKLAATLGLPGDFVRHVTADEAAEIAGIALDTGGLFYPGGGMVHPPALCASLIECAENLETRFGIAVSSLRRDDGCWQALDGDGEVVASADVAVIAAGYGLDGFAQLDGFDYQVLRGQVTFLPADAVSAQLKTVLCHDGYFPPAHDGVHYTGATFKKEPPGDAAPREAEHVENLDKLAANIPALAPTAQRRDGLAGRVGWRIAPPDRLPLVGPVSCTDDPGLYVAAGFGSHGMTTAPLAGALLAAMITGAPLPLPEDVLRRILPARFAARRFRRGEEI